MCLEEVGGKNEAGGWRFSEGGKEGGALKTRFEAEASGLATWWEKVTRQIHPKLEEVARRGQEEEAGRETVLIKPEVSAGLSADSATWQSKQSDSVRESV